MTLLLTDYDEEFAPEELAKLGSFNHSYLQAKLTAYFFSLYTSPKQFKTYSSGLVVDQALDIQLPITEIFG